MITSLVASGGSRFQKSLSRGEYWGRNRRFFPCGLPQTDIGPARPQNIRKDQRHAPKALPHPSWPPARKGASPSQTANKVQGDKHILAAARADSKRPLSFLLERYETRQVLPVHRKTSAFPESYIPLLSPVTAGIDPLIPPEANRASTHPLFFLYFLLPR